MIDAGPNISVEEEAGMPIIDASEAVCQYLFSESSCGWSDHYNVTAIPAGAWCTCNLECEAGPVEVPSYVLQHIRETKDYYCYTFPHFR